MKRFLAIFLMLFVVGFGMWANGQSETPTSTTGVTKATARIVTQSDGLTVEQGNIKNRLEMENSPGKIMHLYIFSLYSGQCILYSTVRGKVTSSGKRLTPYNSSPSGTNDYGFPFYTGDGARHWTSEVLQDDGTYGTSIDYLYWWDVQGVYHQQYVQGGMLLHISDKPLAGVKAVIMNISKE